MSLTGTLISQIVGHAFGLSGEKLITWIEERFTDHTQALPKALAHANDCAWNAVGLALCGDSFFDWFKNAFRDRDLKAVRDQIREFLAVTPTGMEMSPAGLRVRACEEWHRLRKADRFSIGDLSGKVIAKQAAGILRFNDPTGVTSAVQKAVEETAAALKAEAPNLAKVLTLTPPNGGAPLLAATFAFFFRREIETKPEIHRGLTFDLLRISLDNLRSLTARQNEGFTLLADRTEGILGQIDVLFETLNQGFSGMGGKLDELSRKLDERDGILQGLLDFLGKNEVDRNATTQLRVTVSNEQERERVRKMRDALRKLPPELLDASDLSNLGDALAAGGMFKDSLETHEAAATAAREAADRKAEAEAEYKAYRDACETSDFERAALVLQRAVELDAERFQPFPFDRYKLIGVLGSGAFGTVFRCRDLNDLDDHDQPLEVAIKTLHAADLGRDSTKVFAEARTLKKLNHPGIIGIRDQDFADRRNRQRPYFVLEYFAGLTLDQYLRKKPVPSNGFLPLARQIAEAVHAAHQSRILHRDLKPANVMARLLSNGPSPDDLWTWEVRVIDFGLAVSVSSVRTSLSIPTAIRSTRQKSITGTIKYAAPEQLGEMPDVEVGPHSDVYAFGKTCIELLFQTTEPKSWHWKDLPKDIRKPLQELLERCTAPHLEDRYRNFNPVLARLAELTSEKRWPKHSKQAQNEGSNTYDLFSATPAASVLEDTLHTHQLVADMGVRTTPAASVSEDTLHQEKTDSAEADDQLPVTIRELRKRIPPHYANDDLFGPLPATFSHKDKQQDKAEEILIPPTRLPVTSITEAKPNSRALSHREQQALEQAVEFVTTLGGTVERDETSPGKPVVSIALCDKNLTVRELQELTIFKQIRSLDLSNTKVTNAGLRELAELRNLQTLVLLRTLITDEGLKGLAGLSQLRELYLNRTQVTDEGLMELAGLKQLVILDLEGTLVSDIGLKELERLKQLKSLNLNSTTVTDAGLKSLARLKQLDLK